jgi:parallel beta-helix repeat protein
MWASASGSAGNVRHFRRNVFGRPTRARIGALTAAALLWSATPAGAVPGDPGRASTGDPRDVIARQIDAAVGAAADVPPQGAVAVAVTLAGVPAVVVGRDATLADVAAAVPAAVHQPAPGLWAVDRLLVVTRGATLTIAAPAVRELRLLSQAGQFATIVARDANLRIVGERSWRLVVRSWDVATTSPDTSLADGRGSLSVRGGGRLDATDVSFEDLGFFEGRVSGVAATAARLLDGSDPPLTARPTGSLTHSRFVRNLFGAYTYEAFGMAWVDNAFVHNRVYGLDPHDNSDGFLIENNLAAYNGRHGIILSRFCDDDVIRRNRVLSNGVHGIVLDDGHDADGPSDRNMVVGNVVRGNARAGIWIEGSSQNRIIGNRVDGQRYGVLIQPGSSGNVVGDNVIADSGDYGVFVNGGPVTDVAGNAIARAGTGVRLRETSRSLVTGNVMVRMRDHGVKIDGSRGPAQRGIVLAHNRISGSGPSPILSDAGPGDVDLHANTARWNYPRAHDIAAAMGAFVGPGLWALLFATVVFGPLPFLLIARLPRRRR